MLWIEFFLFLHENRGQEVVGQTWAWYLYSDRTYTRQFSVKQAAALNWLARKCMESVDEPYDLLF